MAAAEIEIPMRNARGRQCGREVTVLLLEGVVAAGVEPEVRLVAAERRRNGPEQVERRIRRQPRERPTEDRVIVRRALVPRPALDERELQRCMHGDVDRPIASLGQPADRTSASRGDGSVLRVDRVDHVSGDESAPALVRPDAVGPFLVRERAGRAERHHQDERLRLVPRNQLVLDHAHAHGQQECERSPGDAVEEIEDGVTPVRMRAVAGWEVDVHALAAAPECRARHADLLHASALRHVRRIVRRREAAVEPVVPPVAIDPHEADREERPQDGDRDRHEPARRHAFVLLDGRLRTG